MSELTLNLSQSFNAAALANRATGLAASSSNVSNKVTALQPLPRETQEESETARPVAPVEMEHAVSKIQEYVQHTERRLDFRVDENSGQTVIRVFDKETDDLIRQIPGELALKIAERLNDEEPTLLFRAQV